MEAKLIQQIERYGLKGVLIVAIIWLNNRLSSVEVKLDNCLEERIREIEQIRQKRSHNILYIRPNLVAILPKNDKNKKDEFI